MNILIGLVIVLCLVCSELQTPAETGSIWQRLILVGLVAALVPGFAFIQTIVVSKRLQDAQVPLQQKESTLQRLFACHSAVWLCASLATIWALRWQDVVREAWDLDRWPLLDEVLILAPVLLSLVASWAVFYELQRSAEKRPTEKVMSFAQQLRRRLDFVSIRIRVYVLIVLLPLAIAIFLRDINPWLSSLSTGWQYAIYGLGSIGLALAFPAFILITWKTNRLSGDRRSAIMKICSEHQLRVRDVRVWQTGGQIVNALIAGFVPYLHYIILSDRLIKRFPQNELAAVVRHEAGHIRLFHVPIRLAFILLPMIALSLDEQNGFGLTSILESSCQLLGISATLALIPAAIGYALYLLWVLPWLSRNMEYEADIYACQTNAGSALTRRSLAICPNQADDMADALLRLVAFSPSQFSKRSMFHPSIESRILLLKDLKQNPEKGERFLAYFSRRRTIAITFLTIMCILALLGRLI